MRRKKKEDNRMNWTPLLTVCCLFAISSFSSKLEIEIQYSCSVSNVVINIIYYLFSVGGPSRAFRWGCHVGSTPTNQTVPLASTNPTVWRENKRVAAEHDGSPWRFYHVVEHVR